MHHINYETDLLKHYVRTDGWLAAAQEQERAIRNRSKRIPLRYFTFCAAEAIDVFMLERAEILERAEDTGYLEGVYFCEKNSEHFGKIADFIGSPEQGFLGEFEKIVLFKEDAETSGKTWLEEGENPHLSEIREKLRVKDTHRRFKEAFPFDIVNLDVFGVMFPAKKGIIAPLLESILQILVWQTEATFPINQRPCNRFTLFLTSHIDSDQINQTAIGQLENRVSENISTSQDFRDAFVNRYCHDNVKKLVRENFAEFFCVALPKFVIHQALFHLGWNVTRGPTYLYNRDDKWVEDKRYQMMHTVSVYERIPDFGQRLDAPHPSQYAQIVTQLVTDGIKWVEEAIDTPEIRQELAEDLRQIVEWRDLHR